MVSAFDSGARGSGLSPGWGHCVVFLGKTASLSCWGNLTKCGEVTCDGLASLPGE